MGVWRRQEEEDPVRLRRVLCTHPWTRRGRRLWRARKLWGSHKVCELIHHVMGTDPYSNQLVSPTD